MKVATDWLLTSQRAAIHLPTATAVIADWHLGYAQARRRRGEAVPAISLADAAAPLRTLAAGYDVRRLVVAGDLVEDAVSLELIGDLVRCLNGLGIELAGIVPGNHDRGLDQVAGLPIFPKGLVLGGWRIVHGDAPAGKGRVVQGHVHPCLRWHGRLTVPCYLLGDRRLILPAFSADAAGVNVLGDKCWRAYRCFAVAADAVLDLGIVNRIRGTRAFL